MKFRGRDSMYQVWSSTGDGTSKPGPRFLRLEDAVRFVHTQERGSHAIRGPDGSFHKWPDGNLVVAKGSVRGPAVPLPAAPPSADAPNREPFARGTLPPKPVTHSGDPINRRRFPRAEFRADGEIEVRAEHGASTTLPCSVFSISPSGIGCTISAGPLLDPGTRVTARFADGQRKFTLAGRVVWSGEHAGGASGVGVALHLELAPAAIRREFAHWVISKLRTDY